MTEMPPQFRCGWPNADQGHCAERGHVAVLVYACDPQRFQRREATPEPRVLMLCAAHASQLGEPPGS